jgi:hypothetical protein
VRSHHEHLHSDSDPSGSSDRSFGLVMATALAILSWWKYQEWGQPWISLLIGSAIAMGRRVADTTRPAPSESPVDAPRSPARKCRNTVGVIPIVRIGIRADGDTPSAPWFSAAPTRTGAGRGHLLA